VTVRRTISAVLAAALATGALVAPAATARPAEEPRARVAHAADMRASVATALAEQTPQQPAPATDGSGVDIAGIGIGVAGAFVVLGLAFATAGMPGRPRARGLRSTRR
jgi:hypothetical protein